MEAISDPDAYLYMYDVLEVGVNISFFSIFYTALFKQTFDLSVSVENVESLKKTTVINWKKLCVLLNVFDQNLRGFFYCILYKVNK